MGSGRDERGNPNQLMSVLKTEYVADVAVDDSLMLTPRVACCILPDGVALYHPNPKVVPQKSGSVSGFASAASASP